MSQTWFGYKSGWKIDALIIGPYVLVIIFNSMLAQFHWKLTVLSYVTNINKLHVLKMNEES